MGKKWMNENKKRINRADHWHKVTGFESGDLKVPQNLVVTIWLEQTKTSKFNLNTELHEW